MHQMEALEDSELFEFSTQHLDADSHRLEKGDAKLLRYTSLYALKHSAPLPHSTQNLRTDELRIMRE